MLKNQESNNYVILFVYKYLAIINEGCQFFIIGYLFRLLIKKKMQLPANSRQVRFSSVGRPWGIGWVAMVIGFLVQYALSTGILAALWGVRTIVNLG